MRRRFFAVLAAAALLCCCDAIVSLDGLTGGVGAPDSSVDTSAPQTDGQSSDSTIPAAEASTEASAEADAGSDATLDAAPAAPVVIVTLSGVTAPTGNAQQSHLVWAAAAREWWFFYVEAPDASVLAASFSSDFANWTPAGALALPSSSPDGRDSAATSATLGGGDVAHLAVSVRESATDREHLHVRARISDGGIQFDTPLSVSTTPLNLPALDPDGPATAVLSDGTLFESTAWFQEPDGGATGNSYVLQSNGPDPGGAFTPSFAPPVRLEEVVQVINAHELVPMPGGGILALWESGDVEPDPTNVNAAVWSGTWSPFAPLFPSATQDPNDWGACSLGSDVHAVRYTAASAWQHSVWSGGAVDAGSSIPAFDAQAGGGVVVLGGSRVHVFAIASEAGNPIRTTTWGDPTGGWTPWSDVVTTPAPRAWLSGTITPEGEIALTWTETTGGTSIVAGVLVP